MFDMFEEEPEVKYFLPDEQQHLCSTTHMLYFPIDQVFLTHELKYGCV